MSQRRHRRRSEPAPPARHDRRRGRRRSGGRRGRRVADGDRRDHAGGGADGRPPRRAPAVANKYEVKPGELDEYYVFFSSGQTGEVRIIGLPSMRELMRIPVFNRDSATGWGQTNESLKILTEGLTPREPRVPEGQGRHLHERRPAPPAPVVHRRHLRRALPLRQRQVQHPRLPHPPRRDEVRQDHPAAEPVHRARPARAEVPEDRLRLLQRRGPGADPERRQDPRRPEAVHARCSPPSTARP